MSNQCIKSVLRGWYGPYFPATLTELQAAYAAWAQSSRGLDTSVLIRAAGTMPEYRHPCTEATADGYLWARGLTFKVLRGPLFAGLAVVMFPNCDDKAAGDGTITDRSIAVYTSSQDTIALEDLAELVRRYRQSFESTIRAAAA